MACEASSQAVSFYQTALAIKPETAEIYACLADVLIGQGRLSAGIAIAQAGLLQIDQGADRSRLQTTLERGLSKYATETSALHPEKKVGDKGCNDKIKGVYRSTQDWLYKKKSTVVPIAKVAPPDKQCGGVTCQACMGGLIRRFSPIQVSPKAFRCNPATETEDLTLPTFTTTIPNGRAWIAPKKSGWAVCHEMAIFTADRYLLADLSRAYPWYLPGCKRHDAASHPVLQRADSLPPTRRLPGRVAVLSGLSGHIYYHWLFDVLPRLEILQQDLKQQHLTLSSIDYFVVNNFEKSYQLETLTALGIPVKKIVASDRIPHIEADELIVPSFAGHFDWVPPSSIDFLRRNFLPTDKSVPYQPRPRIYVSRKQAKYRQILNEPEVVELLSQFGFVPVVLETLTVAEQAQLFSQAEVIVSSHGSGLANLTFCSPGATVIECFSPHYLRTDYWMISQYLQLSHYYLIGESFACEPLRQLMYPSGLTEDFSVDISALRSLITLTT